MKNKYSKKQLEELYNCDIFKDSDFDGSHLFGSLRVAIH